MKNKSLHLLLLMSTILLSGCGNNEPKHEYHYESDDPEIVFNYEFNSALQTNLGQIYLVDGQELSDTTLNQLLSILGTNDNYANNVVVTTNSQYLLLKEDDVSKIPGDYIKETKMVLTRNNETNSLSGTVTKHEETWFENELGIPDYSKVEATGTYSLVPNVDAGVGEEVITYNVEEFNSTRKVGYSEQVWGQEMNLTKSNQIGSKFVETLATVRDANKGLQAAYQFNAAVVCNKSENAVEIVLNSKSSQPTTDGSTHEVSYKVSVKVAGGMILETEYLYVELEKTDSAEFVIKLDRELREISYK